MRSAAVPTACVTCGTMLPYCAAPSLIVAEENHWLGMSQSTPQWPIVTYLPQKGLRYRRDNFGQVIVDMSLICAAVT